MACEHRRGTLASSSGMIYQPGPVWFEKMTSANIKRNWSSTMVVDRLIDRGMCTSISLCLSWTDRIDHDFYTSLSNYLAWNARIVLCLQTIVCRYKALHAASPLVYTQWSVHIRRSLPESFLGCTKRSINVWNRLQPRPLPAHFDIPMLNVFSQHRL